MNGTASSERLHIGFFGRSNVGKSSLMNAITGQDLSVVSAERGTTTDPVMKTMELLPLGPVVLFDTPGLDDDTVLGELRMRKARQTLNRTDMAVMVLDAAAGMTDRDREILDIIKSRGIPCVIAVNKSDLESSSAIDTGAMPVMAVSAVTGQGLHELKELICRSAPSGENPNRIVGDLLTPGDMVVLVTPIDAAAPKGRLILPQVQTLRDILDSGAVGTVVRDSELPRALSALSAPPRLVVTDSQVFGRVSGMVPEDVWLTSFSILFSRYKGYLAGAVRGVKALDDLKDGDVVLVSEGCTHHRQCGDIGTEKIPRLVRSHCGRDIAFEFSSGNDFPEDLSKYAVVIHCGGCMQTEREMHFRAKCAEDQGIPFTNYGIALAHMNGILERSIRPLVEKGLL